jgi:hypothetical protein
LAGAGIHKIDTCQDTILEGVKKAKKASCLYAAKFSDFSILKNLSLYSPCDNRPESFRVDLMDFPDLKK